ncbi:hypothetical protein CR513_07611, partial [Mucuna pruriens]
MDHLLFLYKELDTNNCMCNGSYGCCDGLTKLDECIIASSEGTTTLGYYGATRNCSSYDRGHLRSGFAQLS